MYMILYNWHYNLLFAHFGFNKEKKITWTTNLNKEL